MADAIDSLVKAATALIKHVGTSPVVGFALIFLSIYLFDISKGVSSADPIYFWFSRISVPVLFVYGLVAVSLHWFDRGRLPLTERVECSDSPVRQVCWLQRDARSGGVARGAELA